MTHVVYQTDASGVFVGSVVADESPLEPGVWLIPAGCVEIAPPAVAEGQIARLSGGAWIVEAVVPPGSVPATNPAEPAVPASISRRQCAAEMFARELITGAEAVAMTATATPPAAIETILAAFVEPTQTFARIDFAAATYERGNETFAVILGAFLPAATAVDADAFFRAASAR